MFCFLILIAAGLLALPRLRDLGFFGATTTQAPDIEISKKFGNLGVVITAPPPSLSPDVDPSYSGRASSTASIGGPLPGEDLLTYLSRTTQVLSSNVARNFDSGQSITPRTNR